MGRTLNGEVLIDDYGNLNEEVWLGSLIACAKLLKEQREERQGENPDGSND